MAMACKTESKLLSHDELQTVGATHHPAIYGSDLKELQRVQGWLRGERGKIRTLINRSRRLRKGKPDARESGAPANAEHLQERKQVFAKAIRRVNNEIKRLRRFHANAALVDAAQRALATRRANFVASAGGGRTASEGMHPNPSPRRRKVLPRSKIGSVSQATKVTQAIRDARSSVAAAH